jgi:tetratricopeptide (TPR) repeat protein
MNKLARLPAIDRAARASARHLWRVPRRQSRYFAFLSYSHRDEEIADWLHSQLEQFRVPRNLAGHLTENGVIPKRLTPIFRDQHELAAADDLSEEIEEALANSRFLIVLCSPDAAKSRWTNAEIETFKRTRPDGCVLAAIASGEPFASEIKGREAEECFPPALRHRYDRRGRPTGKRAEPLAADLRGGGETRRVGLMKLIAGMLGVGLDDLVQRDATRRQRRLALLAAASLGGMAITSTLAITAIQARDAARDQRREAESLIGFMLGDLKDKLEPIGKLDVLDGVGSRVLDYYKNQDTSKLSDQGLAQRSSALTLMGRIAQARGNLDEAERFIREALSGTAESLRRDPDDPQRIFDHAQNVFWLGELARFRGHRDEADAAYREYKRLADRMVAIDPDNLKWQTEELYAEENLGIVELNHRQFDRAAAHFEDALRLMQAIQSIGPSKTENQKEFATALAWAADAERARGNFDAAVSFRERQIDALNKLMVSAPGSDVRASLIAAHQGMGILLSERGTSDRAIAELKSAITEAENLVPVEPQNAVWKSFAASARLELARNLLATGDRTEALQQTVAACTLVNGLPSSDVSSTKRRLRTDCAGMHARVALADGDTLQASRFADEALASVRTEHTDDPPADRYRVAAMYRLLGDVRQHAGDSQGAAAAWKGGLSEIPTGVTERPWETNVHEQLLRRVGNGGAAEALAARLRSMGFRRTA